MLDRLAVLDAELAQQPGDATRAEDAHQVVIHRQVEPRRTRVALATGSTAQLVVGPAGFVTLAAADVEPTGRHDLVVPRLPLGPQAAPRGLIRGLALGLEFDFEVAAEHDVGASTGHVRRDRHDARTASLRDD